MSKEPLTEERIAEIRSRLHGVSLGEWSHGYSLDVKCNAITCEGRHLFWFVHPAPLKNDKNMEFVAYARQDMNALLDEVERLRAENEQLKEIAWNGIQLMDKAVIREAAREIDMVREKVLRHAMEQEKRRFS